MIQVSAMIRQSVSAPKKSFSKIMSLIFFVAIILNIFIELTNYLSAKLAMIISIVIVFNAILICMYIIKRRVAAYTYTIIDDELIIKRELGDCECTLLNIKVKDIEFIKPIENLKHETKCTKTQRFSCRLRGIKQYYGQYRINNNVYRFIFEPDQRVYGEIFRKLNENID